MASRRALHLLAPSRRALHLLAPSRRISSTPHLAAFGWFDKIKATFTGKKPEDAASGADSSTHIQCVDTAEKARKWMASCLASEGAASGFDSLTLFQYAELVEAAEKYMDHLARDSIIVSKYDKRPGLLRYLGAIDPTGEKLQTSDKVSASKHYNCTVAEVEDVLARYRWFKENSTKVEKHMEVEDEEEERLQMQRTLKLLQNLVGPSPMNVGDSNLAKGQISRNALCRCGSKKRYKRCCGASELENKALSQLRLLAGRKL